MNNTSPKICLHMDNYGFGKIRIATAKGTGLASAYKNQEKVLKELNLQYTNKWDDSCDILQINTPGFSALRLIKKAKSQNKKVIVWTHTTQEDFRGSLRLSSLIAPLLKKYLKYVYSLADLLFCPSEYTKELLIKYGLDPKKIVVQSNGVDISKFKKDKKKALKILKEYKLKSPVVGCVGLVFPKRKGVDSFIFAAKKLPQTNFVWFGKIFNRLLVKGIPKHLPKNTQFTGFVPDIIGALSTIDIFLFTSREENQGMAILEAASMEIPLIVRDIPVYSQYLKHNENCLKAKTNEEFAMHCKNLIEKPGLRKKLAKTARQLAEKHSIENVAKNALRSYKKLMEKL